MAQFIELRYGAEMSSQVMNEKFKELLGTNGIIKGFKVVPGSGLSVSIIKDIDDESALYIKGAKIRETEDIIDIQIDPNSSGSLRTDVLYAYYEHKEDSTCNYYIGQITDFENSCKIATIIVPNGATSILAENIVLEPRLKTMKETTDHINDSAIHTSSTERSITNAHISNGDIHTTTGEKAANVNHRNNNDIHTTSEDKINTANHINDNDIHTNLIEKKYWNEKAEVSYVDTQIAQVSASGIPKLMAYEYSVAATIEGQTKFEIPMDLFDSTTDTLLIFKNRTKIEKDKYTVTNTVWDEGGNVVTRGYITFVDGVSLPSLIGIVILKNVPIGDEGAINGRCLAVESTPMNRVTGLETLNTNFGAHEAKTSTTSAIGHVKLATSTEVTAGTDTTRAVTPAGLKVELDKKISHSLATAISDFLVASGPGQFVKKTLAEVKSILGLGTAAYTDSTAYEPANSNIVKKNVSTTMTAIMTAQNNTSYTTKQMRNITLSTADPSGGGNGDVWIKYKA